MRRLLASVLLALLLISPARATAKHGVWHRLPVLRVTGYDLTGRTATGTWARPGVCAVDPRYIPLGAVIRIPGVGICHAEDTGVYGYWVDVWYATAAACYRVTGTYAGASWR